MARGPAISGSGTDSVTVKQQDVRDVLKALHDARGEVQRLTYRILHPAPESAAPAVDEELEGLLHTYKKAAAQAGVDVSRGRHVNSTDLVVAEYAIRQYVARQRREG